VLVCLVPIPQFAWEYHHRVSWKLRVLPLHRVGWTAGPLNRAIVICDNRRCKRIHFDAFPTITIHLALIITVSYLLLALVITVSYLRSALVITVSYLWLALVITVSYLWLALMITVSYLWLALVIAVSYLWLALVIAVNYLRMTLVMTVNSFQVALMITVHLPSGDPGDYSKWPAGDPDDYSEPPSGWLWLLQRIPFRVALMIIVNYLRVTLVITVNSLWEVLLITVNYLWVALVITVNSLRVALIQKSILNAISLKRYWHVCIAMRFWNINQLRYLATLMLRLSFRIKIASKAHEVAPSSVQLSLNI